MHIIIMHSKKFKSKFMLYYLQVKCRSLLIYVTLLYVARVCNVGAKRRMLCNVGVERRMLCNVGIERRMLCNGGIDRRMLCGHHMMDWGLKLLPRLTIGNSLVRFGFVWEGPNFLKPEPNRIAKLLNIFQIVKPLNCKNRGFGFQHMSKF